MLQDFMSREARFRVRLYKALLRTEGFIHYYWVKHSGRWRNVTFPQLRNQRFRKAYYLILEDSVVSAVLLS